jgi:penicillin-binding protein 1A
VAINVCSDSGYLATPYCPNAVSKVFVKRPYTVDPHVGDYGYEQPSYYCNLHNPNPALFPIDPNKTLSPGSDNTWDGSGGNPDGGGIVPIDPGNGNGSNNGNGNGNGTDNGGQGNGIPDWVNLFDR